MSKVISDFSQPVYLLLPTIGSELTPDTSFNLLVVIMYENKQLSLFQQPVLHKKNFYREEIEFKELVFDVRYQKGRQILVINKPMRFFGGTIVTPKNWCPRVCMCSTDKKDSIVKWINALNGKKHG